MSNALNELEKKVLLTLRPILTQLYPKGEIRGKEFLLGNVEGDAGTSLSINMVTGLWGEFASSGSQGRILKFFAYRNGGDFAKGIEEVRSLLKLPPNPISNKYKRPKKDWLEDVDYTSTPLTYLLKDRKIPRSVLSASKVRENGKEYIFIGHDEEGKLCYAQYISRTPDGDKKVRFSVKSKLPLWGMHTMRRLASHSGSVVITEGVIDAMTFRAMDVFAVSIPSGINNKDWIQHSWNWLSQFETIYLAFDYDEAGQEDITEIAARLGIHRCKKVIIPEKDANACLQAHPDNWTQLLRKYLDEAIDFAPPKRLTANEIKDKVIQSIAEGPLMDRGDLLLGWHFEKSKLVPRPINFRFRPQEMTIWSGYAGGGKTALLLQHAAYCMCVLGEKVAIASLEEPSENVITILLSIILNEYPDPSTKKFERAYKIINDKLILFNELGMSPLKEILDFFEFSVRKDGVKHCILDSIMCTDIDIDGDKAEVNAMVKTIIQSLNATRAHYNIVAHCVKGDDEDWSTMPKQKDIKGIQEITARAHNVMIVWRNKVKESSLEAIANQRNKDDDFKATEAERKRIEQPDTIIKITKNRNGKKIGQIKAWYNLDTGRFRPTPYESDDGPYLADQDDDPR